MSSAGGRLALRKPSPPRGSAPAFSASAIFSRRAFSAAAFLAAASSFDFSSDAVGDFAGSAGALPHPERTDRTTTEPKTARAVMSMLDVRSAAQHERALLLLVEIMLTTAARSAIVSR